jgi:hypothetical protein
MVVLPKVSHQKMKVVTKNTSIGGDARRNREGQQHKWELEEGILLKFEWTKEFVCMFSLKKGVSKLGPLQFCIFSE